MKISEIDRKIEMKTKKPKRAKRETSVFERERVRVCV